MHVVKKDSPAAAQIDAVEPSVDRLQIGVTAGNFRMIEATRAAFRATEERKGAVDDLHRRLGFIGRGDFQAEHARQQRAVVTFESQHVDSSQSPKGLRFPTGADVRDRETRGYAAGCANRSIREANCSPFMKFLLTVIAADAAESSVVALGPQSTVSRRPFQYDGVCRQVQDVFGSIFKRQQEL